MRDTAMKNMIRLAEAKCGPFCRIAADAVEAGFVSPTRLRTALKAAGLRVEAGPNPDKENRGFATVFAKSGPKSPHHQVRDAIEANKHDETALPKEVVVARGYSGDADDALLQAVYAEMLEEERRGSRESSGGSGPGAGPESPRPKAHRPAGRTHTPAGRAASR